MYLVFLGISLWHLILSSLSSLFSVWRRLHLSA